MIENTNPYATPETDAPQAPAPAPAPRFEVQARLNLAGTAEFTGVRNHPDRAPTSEMRVCGIDLVFATPAEAEQFAAAAQVMAAQLHVAWERNGLIPRQVTPPGLPL